MMKWMKSRKFVEKSVPAEKITFSDRMRIWFKWAIDPLAAFFNCIGLTPNTMTLLGLAGNFVGAYFVSTGTDDDGWYSDAHHHTA